MRSAFSSLARWAAKRTSAKRRKIRPRTGAEYSWDLSPELARNWSAASQRRFSSVAVAASFSLGATQRMQLSPQTGRTVVPGHYGLIRSRSRGRGVVTRKIARTVANRRASPSHTDPSQEGPAHRIAASFPAAPYGAAGSAIGFGGFAVAGKSTPET